MRFLRLHGITTEERHAAIHAARDALSQGGAAIVNHQMFSNLSICFAFEVPPEDLGLLLTHLQRTRIKLSDESVRQLLQDRDGPELKGTLEVTFLHNDPDLKQDVPAFG